jgi:DNA repair exonuclease SbcCD nuclease subunit
MLSLVWRTDVHLSDVAPSSRKDDWAATVLDKLRQVGAVASERSAVAVLDGGDFFHVKSPSRNSHDLVRRAAEVHAAYPCPTFANVGNHDCVYGDIEYLDQQPLGVLFSSGILGRCYDHHEVFFGPGDGGAPRAYGYNRALDSWSDGNPFDLPRHPTIPIVRVVGVPYHGTRYDLDKLSSIKRGQEDHLVCMAHLLASKGGGTMFEGEDIISYDTLPQYAPTCWLFGHWHQDQGVEDFSGIKVVNVGSLTRGSLTLDEVQRTPACVVLSFTREATTHEVVRLNVKPAADVFDVEGRVRAVKRATTMDAFVKSVRESLSPISDVSPEDSILSTGGDVPEKVRIRVLSYLERAGTSG